MKKEAGKRGQFYLIAAIVVAVVIIGVAVVSNYVKKESGINLSDLKEEIKTESSYVMDYALVNELGQSAFDNLLINFTETYTDYFKREKSHYFIFGDEDEITVSGYQKEGRTVYLNDALVTSSGGDFTKSIDPETQNITLKIDDNSYSFPISEGKNFYFVISQSIGNEEHTIAG